MSWQNILGVIYSFSSCFRSQFNLLERNFCTCFWRFWHIFSSYWSFFSEAVAKSILGVIYSSPSPSFWDRYPTFFWFKRWDLRQFWHISSVLFEVFFWMTCQIHLRVIYPYSLRFCRQLDLLEGKIWGRHPFLWLSSWFKKWHSRQFWHFSSTYWRICSEWVSKSF